MKKNTTVATAEVSKTTQDTITTSVTTKKDKTPTGKVKNLAARNERKKAREEQYKQFRIGALRRRAKRMGLTPEETEEKVKELIKQIEAPNMYNILVMFNKNDVNLVKNALANDGLVTLVMTNDYCYIEGDQEVLNSVREIMPPTAKIHPYAKKKPPILPAEDKKEPQVVKKKPMTKAEKKAVATKAKKDRKAAKIKAHNDRKVHAKQRKESHKKKMRLAAKHKKLFDKKLLKAKKKSSGATAKTVKMKPSTSPKKAPTALKKAA